MIRWSVLLVAAAATAAFAGDPSSSTPAAAATSRWILANVHVFDPLAGRMSDPTDIVIDGDRIVSVGSATRETGVPVVDGEGRYAVPGLFDCHTHLAELTLESEDSMRAALRAFVERGITQVRDVGGPLDRLARLRERIDSGDLLGPDLFYAGPMLEGSPLTWGARNTKLPGFTVAVDSDVAADSLLDAIAAGGARGVKLFGHIDRPVFERLVDGARARGLPVAHDPGPPLFHRDPVDLSIDLGVATIEHGKAPWPVVLRDDLRAEHDSMMQAKPFAQMRAMAFAGRVAALGDDSIVPDRVDAIAARMVQRGVFLCPTLQVFAAMAGDTSMAPPIAAMVRGMETVSRSMTARMARGGVEILVGQDGCDAAGTFAEMRELARCGIPPVEILRGATIRPARLLGEEDRLGSIAPGRTANLLVVDADPLEEIGNLERTRLVVLSGRSIERGR
ncbi:MAG: amidohydrolase family protein [Candidatus Eisenbacteria bacterium]